VAAGVSAGASTTRRFALAAGHRYHVAQWSRGCAPSGLTVPHGQLHA
jgi:hypothetical protein